MQKKKHIQKEKKKKTYLMANYKRSLEGEEAGRHVEGRVPSLLLECLGLYLHVGVIIHYKPGMIFAHLCFAAREKRNQGLQCQALERKGYSMGKTLGFYKMWTEGRSLGSQLHRNPNLPFFQARLAVIS